MPQEDSFFINTGIGNQLIFTDGTNTVALPYTTRDKYECYPEEVGSQIQMISGRVVWESRGHVQKIHYQYDCMGNILWRQVAAFLRSSRSFSVSYLPDDGDEMRSGIFICESLSPPKYAFEGVDTLGRPAKFWHNIDFTLREVSPHD